MIMWPENNEVILAIENRLISDQYMHMLGQYGIKAIPIQEVLPDFDFKGFNTHAEFANVLKIAKDANAKTNKATIAELTSLIDNVHIRDVNCKMFTSLVYIDSTGGTRGFSGTVYGNVTIDSSLYQKKNYRAELPEEQRPFTVLHKSKSLGCMSPITAYHNNSSGVAISRLMESLIDTHFLKTNDIPMLHIGNLEDAIELNKITAGHMIVRVVSIDRKLLSKRCGYDNDLEDTVDDIDIIIDSSEGCNNLMSYTIDGHGINTSRSEGYAIDEIFELIPVAVFKNADGETVRYRTTRWDCADDFKQGEGYVVYPQLPFPIVQYDQMQGLISLIINHAFGRKLAYKMHLVGISEIVVTNAGEYELFSKILGSGGTQLIKLSYLNTL